MTDPVSKYKALSSVLEDKIKIMNSQVLVGGKKLEDTPQFIIALEEKQKVIHKEYQERLLGIEKERQQFAFFGERVPYLLNRRIDPDAINDLDVL